MKRSYFNFYRTAICGLIFFAGTTRAETEPSDGVRVEQALPAAAEEKPSPQGSRQAGDEPADMRFFSLGAHKLMEDGQPVEALNLLLQGLNRFPDDLTLRLLIATAHCQMGDYDGADWVLHPLSEEFRDHPTVHILQGSVYFANGKTREAAAEMKLAIKLAPDSQEAHFNLAQISLAAKRPDLKTARKHYGLYIEAGGTPDPRTEALLAR